MDQSGAGIPGSCSEGQSIAQLVLVLFVESQFLSRRTITYRYPHSQGVGVCVDVLSPKCSITLLFISKVGDVLNHLEIHRPSTE